MKCSDPIDARALYKIQPSLQTVISSGEMPLSIEVQLNPVLFTESKRATRYRYVRSYKLSYRMSPLEKQTLLVGLVNCLAESSVNKELTVSAWVGIVK
jgi:hypothetical protein